MDEKSPSTDADNITTAPDQIATNNLRTKESVPGSNDVENHAALPTQSQVGTQDIVDWEGENDPSKPMNW